MKNSVIAVILGGGQGTRLFPLTKLRSKPAVPIGGKYRLVDIPISNCLNSEIRRIFVLTQFNSASLNRHIKNTYNFDAFSNGFVDILAAEQTLKSENWYQGTADAVRQSLHHLENIDHQHVLILSGDQLYQMDYRNLVKAHAESGADMTVATIPVTAERATDLGIMKKNDRGLVEAFQEKPGEAELNEWKSETSEHFSAEGRNYLGSMGIYIFKKHVLQQLFDENPEAADFGKEIIPKAIYNSLKVHSYEFDGYWIDVGTIKSFFKANLDLTDDLPAFNLFDNERAVYTRARLLPASKLSGATFEHSVVAEGCIIEADRIEHSVIGIRSRIGPDSTINDSIIMGNDFFESMDELRQTSGKLPMGIGKNCVIERAIIDKNCRIGNNVQITGGDHLEDGDYGSYHVVDGIVIIPKNVVIEAGSSI